jgi:hypothetical protein
MKARIFVLMLAMLVVLVSFSLISLHNPAAKAAGTDKAKAGTTYRSEPLGGFVAEDPL